MESSFESHESLGKGEEILNKYLFCVDRINSGSWVFDDVFGLIDLLSGFSQDYSEEYSVFKDGNEYFVNEKKILEWALDMGLYAVCVDLNNDSDIDLDKALYVAGLKGELFGFDEGSEDVRSQEDLYRHLETMMFYRRLRARYDSVMAEVNVIGGADIELIGPEVRGFMADYREFVKFFGVEWFDEGFIQAVKALESVEVSDLTEKITEFKQKYMNDSIWDLDYFENFYYDLMELSGLLNLKKSIHGLSDVEKPFCEELGYLERIAFSPLLIDGFKEVFERFGWGDENIDERLIGLSKHLEAMIHQEMTVNGFKADGYVRGYWDYRYLDNDSVLILSEILSNYAIFTGDFHFDYLAVCNEIFGRGLEPYGISSFFEKGRSIDDVIAERFEAEYTKLESMIADREVDGEDYVHLLLKKKALGGFDSEQMDVLESELIKVLEADGELFDNLMSGEKILNDEEFAWLIETAVRFKDAFEITRSDGEFHKKFGSNAKFIAMLTVKSELNEKEISIGEMVYNLRPFQEYCSLFKEHVRECADRNRVICFDQSVESGNSSMFGLMVDVGASYEYVSNMSFCSFLKLLIDTQIRCYGDADGELDELLGMVEGFIEILEIPKLMLEASEENVDEDLVFKLKGLLVKKRDVFRIELDRLERNYLDFGVIGDESTEAENDGDDYCGYEILDEYDLASESGFSDGDKGSGNDDVEGVLGSMMEALESQKK